MISTDKIKDILTTEDIISLATTLQGSDEYYYDAQNHPIFNTMLDHPADNGNSFKLYYYPETCLFHCYTGTAESYDVFELVCRAKECDFRTAYNFIINFFHLTDDKTGFDDDIDITSLGEWDIFQKVADYSNKSTSFIKQSEPIQENILEYFYPLSAPVEWIKEGILPHVMYHYGIRIDSALSKIIIPHRNINGELVGIRGRSFDCIELDSGKKYMPIWVEKTMYNHSLGQNLYGLYENKDTIQRVKKVLVCEGEKSVLQAASFYGLDNCFAVATCGSSFSKDQMSLLLNLGVEECILAYDREFEGGRGAPDTITYEDKLMKVVTPLLPYVNVSVIVDYDHLLPYKGSPTDCGKEIFETLYHSRIKLYTENKNTVVKQRRRY